MMTLADWLALDPAAAARRVHERVAALPAGQQRALFATLTPEPELADALAAARVATPGRAPGPLAGVPYVLKDLFDVAGLPTLAGSTFLDQVRPTPTRDGALVATLRAAGAVLAGKTHLHEFAYGITGENPHYGDCQNPRDATRTTGGSSSGSAAAVAAGIVPLAIGTDTGGSVRVPSAFCGLYGFRLTPHHPWIRDAVPLAPRFDAAGWFTAHPGDMVTVLDALLGPALPADDCGLRDGGLQGGGGLRGGWLELPGLDADTATAYRTAAASLAPALGAGLQAELTACFAPAAELYAVLGGEETWAYHAPWAEAHRTDYDPAVWARLERSRALTRPQLDAAEVAAARIARAWSDYFATHDFMLLPASPCAALTKAECNLANRNRLLSLTAPTSLGGLPVLTLPVALPSGLSTGVQVVAPYATAPVFRRLLAAWPRPAALG